MEFAMIVTIVELIAKYGVPTALKIIKAWQVENPTADDFRALAQSMPPAEEYFATKTPE
jgi:hypothetical protein